MTTTDAPTIPDHPATFSRNILAKLRDMVAAEREARGAIRVLDPFAGVGTIHQLAEAQVSTVGVELHPAWAAAHPDTICGSVVGVPAMFDRPFDVVATSPCYGNRMADSHDAREDSKRNTYAHALRRTGHEPVRTPDDATVMQWGPTYRAFHEDAWRACDRVLVPGALALINVKNHVRGGEVQRVAEWHLNVWLMLGYTVQEVRRIPTRGLAHGANHDLRVDAELVLALRKPT